MYIKPVNLFYKTKNKTNIEFKGKIFSEKQIRLIMLSRYLISFSKIYDHVQRKVENNLSSNVSHRICKLSWF